VRAKQTPREKGEPEHGVELHAAWLSIELQPMTTFQPMRHYAANLAGVQTAAASPNLIAQPEFHQGF
jgi:hypothetical protein